MERQVTNTMMIEWKGIFDKNRKKRFELTFICKDSKQKKSILVIGLNPASKDISIIDTTTTFILNNLFPMGYTTITICNLYGELFKQRLKPSEVPNNTENRKYLEEVLKRGFDTILLGYGNTFLTNKFVKEEKAYLRKLLNSYKEKVVDIVDDKGEYERLTAIHPLMAGRYFPGRWKLRPFVFEKKAEDGDESTTVNPNKSNGEKIEKTEKARDKKLPEKAEKSWEGEQAKKTAKSMEEEGVKIADEKRNPNQNIEPVVSAETA